MVSSSKTWERLKIKAELSNSPSDDEARANSSQKQDISGPFCCKALILGYLSYCTFFLECQYELVILSSPNRCVSSLISVQGIFPVPCGDLHFNFNRQNHQIQVKHCLKCMTMCRSGNIVHPCIACACLDSFIVVSVEL